jgi:hypothetical protein
MTQLDLPIPRATPDKFHPAAAGDICIAVDKDTGSGVVGIVVLVQNGEAIVIDTGAERVRVANMQRLVEPQKSFRGGVVEAFGRYPKWQNAKAAVSEWRRA